MIWPFKRKPVEVPMSVPSISPEDLEQKATAYHAARGKFVTNVVKLERAATEFKQSRDDLLQMTGRALDLMKVTRRQD